MATKDERYELAWERMQVYGLQVDVHPGIGATLDGTFTLDDLRAIIARMKAGLVGAPISRRDVRIPTLEDLKRERVKMIKRVTIKRSLGTVYSWKVAIENVPAFVKTLLVGGAIIEDDLMGEPVATLIAADDIKEIVIDEVVLSIDDVIAEKGIAADFDVELIEETDLVPVQATNGRRHWTTEQKEKARQTRAANKKTRNKR